MTKGPRPIIPVLLTALGSLLLMSCEPEATPKPRGWFRIDLPVQEYALWTDSSTMSAELPTYAEMVQRPQGDGSRWYDMRFSQQRATLHLTWTRPQGHIGELIEDAHTFKGKHELKAARIDRERVLRDDARVYGTLFDVEGDVASPFVFYLTDSVDNFVYGALYFDAPPNADSLAPVTQRIREDARHFARTLAWR